METFSSAAHLKGVVFQNLPVELHPLRDVINRHLEGSELGGLARNTSGQFPDKHWHAIPATGADVARPVPSSILTRLRSAFPDDPPDAKQIPCVGLTKSGMQFSIYTKSSRDSQVSYKGPTGDVRFGRIFAILAEPKGQADVIVASRIWIIVERYDPLSGDDVDKDIYNKHPLIGGGGYRLAEMMYDSFVRALDIIQPSQIIGHIARCSLETGSIGSFRRPVFVAVQLDRVSDNLQIPAR